MYKVTVNDQWLSVEGDETSYTCRLEDVHECYVTPPPIQGTAPQVYEHRLFITVERGGNYGRAYVLLARSQDEPEIQRYYRRTIRAIMAHRQPTGVRYADLSGNGIE